MTTFLPTLMFPFDLLLQFFVARIFSHLLGLQSPSLLSGRLTATSLAQMVDELSLPGLENTAGLWSFGL